MLPQNIKKQMMDDLVSLIQIKSVIDEESGIGPFGKGIDDALKRILDISKNLGYKTYYDPNGYYGYAEIGQGEDLVGILGHVDVVPEGDETLWTYPPYEGYYNAEAIYGRGTTDDKGPLIGALYAMKMVVDEGLVLNRRFRFIFGTDEENHWRGICRYMKEQESPCCGFTPDSSFPVVYAEKGLLQLKLTSKKPADYEVKGGTAMNAVPESAIYTGENQNKIAQNLKKLGFDYVIEGDDLIVIGRAAHAAKPNSGINAISRLALAIDDEEPVIRFIKERIGLTTDGTYMFGNLKDEISGKLTLNVAQIDMSKFGQYVALDIRFPVTFTKKFVLEAIKRIAEKYNLEVVELDYLAPNYVPVDSPFIKTLIGAYESVTGLDGRPISTGGATYARSMKNCVAFGVRFPGIQSVAHQTDEFLSLNHLEKSVLIYAKAIKEINALEDLTFE